MVEIGNEDDENDEAATEEDEWEEDGMVSIVPATAAVLNAPRVLLSTRLYWWRLALPHLANIIVLQSTFSEAGNHDGTDDQCW